MPELPHARVPIRPERPAHPLHGYANVHDYALNGGLLGQNMQSAEVANPNPTPPLQGIHDDAHPMVKGVQYPDQKPGPEFY